MPTIIRLRGAGGSGKTTTLKLLIAELKKLGATEKMKHANSDNRQTKDCIAILEYNGKTIGIVTAGDTIASLNYGYDEIFKHLQMECDIYVFACRTKGETNNWFDKKFPASRLITFEKWGVFDTTNPACLQIIQDEANIAQVHLIIETIK